MIDKLREFGDALDYVSLKDHNTYKIDASARYLILPDNVDRLKDLLTFLKENNINYIVLGNGSNVILDDGFYDGAIIKLSNFDELTIDGDTIYAGAGILLPKLSRKLINNDLVGLEWACGIPGTLGGSIVGNAGAYKADIFDHIIKVKVLDTNTNEIKELTKDEIKYSYRYSSFKDNKNLLVLGAYLKVSKGNKEESLNLINRRMKKRLETQPLDYPSAGSVFRNPANDFAGRIIEEDIKFKGKQVGGAKVSDKHANFIINYDNATGSDIRNLISLIKKQVKEKDNIDLIVEQEIIDWK